MQYVLPSLSQPCTTYGPAVVTRWWWSVWDIMWLLTVPSSHHISCGYLKFNLETAHEPFRCHYDLLLQNALMQVAQLGAMTVRKPGLMAMASSCQRLDLAFAQKTLYGNSEVFVVPSTACYWLVWQEGLQAVVEQQSPPSEESTEAEGEPWNWAVHGAFSQGLSTLAGISQG